MTAPPDLSVLSRNRPHGDAGAGVHDVPRPRARWRTRVLVPTLVLLATAGVLGYAARDVLRSEVPVRVAPVVPTGRVGGSDGGQQPHSDHATPSRGGPIVQAPGWIEPDPYATSVPALAEGVVREVLVLEGERVEAGQVVVRFIDDDAKLQLAAAEALLTERRADAERSKAAAESARARALVERATLSELRDEVDRKRELAQSGGIGAGEFRRLELRLTGAEALALAAESAVEEAVASIAQAEAAVTVASVARDEAALRLSRMEVRSPVAGVVLSRLVEPGSRMSMGPVAGEGSQGGAVLRLYDPERLQVRVDVPLADAAKVGVGSLATVTTEAIPDTTFTGVVTRVVQEANIQRNTVQFKVRLDSPSPVMKPEMLARVGLHAPGRQNGAEGGEASGVSDGDGAAIGLLVPTAAIRPTTDGRAMVWLVELSDGSAKALRREITTRPSSHDGYVHVTSGLTLTDRVVLEPPATLRDGTRLRVIEDGTRNSPSSEASNPAAPGGLP
jgi:HlyD family secretion protein